MFWLHNDFEELAQRLRSGQERKTCSFCKEEKKNHLVFAPLLWANELLSPGEEAWKEAELGWALGVGREERAVMGRLQI